MSYEEVLPLSHQYRWFTSDKSYSDSPRRPERQNQLHVGKPTLRINSPGILVPNCKIREPDTMKRHGYMSGNRARKDPPEVCGTEEKREAASLWGQGRTDPSLPTKITSRATNNRSSEKNRGGRANSLRRFYH